MNPRTARLLRCTRCTDGVQPGDGILADVAAGLDLPNPQLSRENTMIGHLSEAGRPPEPVPDLDDTTHCGPDRWCLNCGTGDDLDVGTAGSPLGVFCLTLCGRCAGVGSLPRLSAGRAAQMVGLHCAHLGVDLDHPAVVDAGRRFVRGGGAR